MTSSSMGYVSMEYCILEDGLRMLITFNLHSSWSGLSDKNGELTKEGLCAFWSEHAFTALA